MALITAYAAGAHTDNARFAVETVTGVDNGIPADARPLYDAWVSRVATGIRTKGDGLDQAYLDNELGNAKEHYERYRVMRDCAEFDSHGVRRTPQDYCAMLVARFPVPKTNADVEANGKALVELFGEAKLLESSKAVQES